MVLYNIRSYIVVVNSLVLYKLLTTIEYCLANSYITDCIEGIIVDDSLASRYEFNISKLTMVNYSS